MTAEEAVDLDEVDEVIDVTAALLEETAAGDAVEVLRDVNAAWLDDDTRVLDDTAAVVVAELEGVALEETAVVETTEEVEGLVTETDGVTAYELEPELRVK